MTVSPPEDRTVSAPDTGIVYRLQAQIVETNTLLPVQNLSGTLTWNDGGLPVIVNGSGTISVDESRTLVPGNYLITLSGHNFALGSQQTASVTFGVTVEPALKLNPSPGVIYGPILPRDQGFPSPKDWLFHSASDIHVLESSAKMLLGTAKGERLMEPDYGTNIRQLLFNAADASVDAIVEQEIVEALARWEPRLELQFFRLERLPNSRTVTVHCTLLSKLTRRGFELALYFEQ